MKAIVTGSGGLIGSESVRLLSEQGWEVAGIDNDMRRRFFGTEGSTKIVAEELQRHYPSYRHFETDITDRSAIRDLFAQERPDFIVHAAAQTP